MARLTPESFLNIVRQSKLLTKDKIKTLITEMQTTGVDLTSTGTVANWMIEKGHLTEWQVDKLKQLRHKGFFLGKYRLLRLLGKGGMSSVYLAEHTLMRRRCAVKVLPIKKVHDSSYLARFYREAQAVASLDHPNIVRAYDIDHEVEKDQEIHFLVMEYIKGYSIQELIKTNGPLSFELAAEYFRQAANGLDHAHRSGLIHRDVKPGNLLVDESGVVKVLDLGLARFAEVTEENPLTVAHDEKVLGTADYLSPEQALDSHAVDARADIYSMGCTMSFVLTGHPPFNEGTIAQRLLWHQTKDPPPITDSRPDTPASLCDIINKMMKKIPDERYQSMSEIADALTEWLNANASPELQPTQGDAPQVASTPAGEFAAFSSPADSGGSDLGSTLVGVSDSGSQAGSDAGFTAFLSNLQGDPPATSDSGASVTVAQPTAAPPQVAAAPETTTPVASLPVPTAAPVVAPAAPVAPAAAPIAPAAPVASPPAAPVVPAAPVAQPVVIEPPQSAPAIAPAAVVAVAPTIAPDSTQPVSPAPPTASPIPVAAIVPVAPPANPVPQAPAVAFDNTTSGSEPPATTISGISGTLDVPSDSEGADMQTGSTDSAVTDPPSDVPQFPDVGFEPNPDPVFDASPIEDDSVSDFPSLFQTPGTIAEGGLPNEPKGEATVSELETAPNIPAPVSNHEDATVIVPHGNSSNFPDLPTQSGSVVEPPAPTLPVAPFGAPAIEPPATGPDFLTATEPNAGEPNFGSFGEPVQAAPLFQPENSVPEAVATGNQPPTFGNANPGSLAEQAPMPSSAGRRPAPKKSPIGLIVGGLVVVAVAVGCFFMFFGDDKKNKNQTQAQGTDKKDRKSSDSKTNGSTTPTGALKLRLEVGPDAEFKSIAQALAHVKKDNLRYASLPRRRKILIEVAANNTYNESIVIDNSDANYPRGIHIIAKEGRATLKATGGPALRLQSIEFFGLEGFDIDARGNDTAIELGGFLSRNRLFDLKVTGYKTHGVLAKGACGVSSDYLVLENLEFKPSGSGSTGMSFTNGQAPTGRVRIKGCKFFGPTNTCIDVGVGVNFFEIRENIFEKSNVGVQLGKSPLTWRNVVLTNNTFYQGKIGVAIGAMPAAGSSDFAMHRNLFAGQTGPELVIQDGFDDKKFDRVISAAGGIDRNFSDRNEKPSISAGERDVVIRDEQRVSEITFKSTSPSSDGYLATEVKSAYGRVGGQKMGSQPYIGAVAPK